MSQRMARRGKPSRPGHRPGRNASERTVSSSTPPMRAMKEDDEDRKLWFSMDYGTKTLSLACRVARLGDKPVPDKLYDVHFSEHEYWAPQVAAWADDGTFYWGYGIDRALKQKHIRQEDVLQLWKLLLYKDHKTSSIARRVQLQLGGRTVSDLLTTHLRAIIKTAKNEMKRRQTSGLTAEMVDKLPMQLFLSVPQMWSPPAVLAMMQAAKDAGITWVEPVFEPQCAAAYFTHTVSDYLPVQLEAGGILVIADVGGGTGDFISYELTGGSDDGAIVGLLPVGKAEGALCGSEFVNQEFLKWLVVQPDDFDAQCAALGLTRPACMMLASASFETVKQKFSVPEAGPELVVVQGAPGAAAGHWVIQVTRDMVRFFDPVIKDIMRCIDTQMANRRTSLIKTVLLVPGGFGRSEYLMTKIKERYAGLMKILPYSSSTVGVYQPVSRGALLRYKDIRPRTQDFRGSFGIGQVESYDKRLHPDATYFRGDVMPNGRICKADRANDKIVEKDDYNSSQIVYERWLPLLQGSTVQQRAGTFTTETWQQYMIHADDQTMSVQVYWTEIVMAEHDAILTGANILNSEVRDGIEPWGPPLQRRLPDLAAAGFTAVDSDRRGVVFEIYYRLALEYEGANVKIHWQIAKPGTQPYDQNGAHRVSKFDPTDDQVIALYEENHNPFPRVSLS